MKKFFVTLLFSLFFLFLGFLLFFFAYFYHSMPKIKGEVSLKGLTTEVIIIKDYWGVPHIFAQNEKDLFFACGYAHAQERMWQMDLNRRAGFGRLSEVFGKMALEKDKLMRNLSLKEAAFKDYEKLSSRMKERLLSYSDGVNSWIDSRRFNWPPEFLLLRYRPQPWRPIDSLIIKDVMAFLLCTDFQSEILRAKLVKHLGAQKALEILEEGIEIPSSGFNDVSLSDWLSSQTVQASNNWVLSGNRTESGKPLLANDPHLEITLPPIWFEIHLNCPTINVVGVSIPGLPLVIIGHNESISWGMTNSAADVQDLFIEKISSSQDMYLDKDGWKPLMKIEEVIRIKGEKEPERMEIRWTARGPIISPFIVESQTPVSLSWTIYQGGRTFESLYLLNKAQNWDEFVDAVKLFDAPSQNFVYADRHGNIGYYLSGKIPIRREETALFPVPGWEEEGHWKSFIDEEEKPNLYNPDKGYIITANNKIIPDDFPYYISFDWDAPFRAERIEEILLQREKHNIESFKRIQNDVFSKKSERLLPFLREIDEKEGDLSKALNIVKQWNLEMKSGKEPALYEVFMDIFHEEVLKDELGENFEKFDSLFRRKKAGLLRILDDPFSSWFDKKGTSLVETREDIIRISLEKAYKWLEKNYGDPEKWDWMKINSVDFKHVLGEVPVFRFFNRGSHPSEGNAFTVRASFSKGNNTTWGVSFRQIIDLSNLKNSICVLTSGQSGHFLSRFYDDQIPLWLEGRYHPMLFYSEDIEAKAKGNLWLKPLLRK